jgi:hypothetical protein
VQQIKSEISSDGMHVFFSSIFLYNIYLFTFVFILAPVMCNLFPKRGNAIFEIE